MLLGLTGYAGSGKNTVADILVREHGFKQYAFADKLRELVYAQNPCLWIFNDARANFVRELVDAEGWDTAKRDYPEVRELLQNTGVWMRENVSEDFWVDLVSQAISDDDARNVVVTDVRFPNEADWIHWGDTDPDAYSGVVRVSRPGVGPVNGHCSEKLDFPHDYDLVNAGTVADLERSVAQMLRHFRPLEGMWQ